jgi:hypothetical protein
MKKRIAALVGAAVLFAVFAGALYLGYHLFVAGKTSADGHAGEGAIGLLHLKNEILPPDPRSAEIERSLREKDQVARAVIDGRLTLVEAAARFRAINASRPANLPVCLDQYPGKTDEERVCREVIGYVETRLPEQPGTSAFLARLESELEAHLAAGGTAQGPNFPAQAPKKSAD